MENTTENTITNGAEINSADVNSAEINCAEACLQGCVLGDRCPNLEHKADAMKFVNATSLDQMLEIAEAARLRKMMEPPKWVLPEE